MPVLLAVRGPHLWSAPQLQNGPVFRGQVQTILEGRDEVEVVVKEAEHVLVAHKMKRISGTLLAHLTAAVADRVELGY
jgi:predicted small metal-binding protein